MKNFTFCGLLASSFTEIELTQYIEDSIQKKTRCICYGHSLGIFPRLVMEPETYEYINDYDLYVSDGHKFHLFGKKLGFPFEFMISLPQLSLLSLEIANKLNSKVLLLGSTEKNNAIACANIESKYKGIKSCDGLHGYFIEEEEEEIVARINQLKPDIIFLGMTSPKKEKFIYKWKDKINQGIIILNGGMIDVVAGKAVLTPPILKKLGLALIFRFIQAPRNKIRQFLIYYPLIIFYFVPAIFLNIKILGRSQYHLKDMLVFHKHKEFFAKCQSASKLKV